MILFIPFFIAAGMPVYVLESKEFTGVQYLMNMRDGGFVYQHPSFPEYFVPIDNVLEDLKEEDQQRKSCTSEEVESEEEIIVESSSPISKSQATKLGFFSKQRTPEAYAPRQSLYHTKGITTTPSRLRFYWREKRSTTGLTMRSSISLLTIAMTRCLQLRTLPRKLKHQETLILQCHLQSLRREKQVSTPRNL